MTDELKQWEYDRGYEKGRADVLAEIRAEIEKPIWIEYSITGTSQNEILELVDEVMRKMKIEVIKIIDKYSKGGDSDA